jgi:hypothetical protein
VELAGAFLVTVLEHWLDKKVAIFAFNGETMCFAHALLNARDMKKKGYDIKIVKEITDSKLIDCVCEACSGTTGSLDSAKEQGLPICNEMSGHPSISRYKDEGYEVIVF